MSKLILIALMLSLSACAVPLKSQEMSPQYDFYDTVSSKKFDDSIFIRNVDVPKAIGGASPVTPEEFKAALISAFRQADYYETPEKAKYALEAVMTEMKQPFMGFNLTVTATTDYKIFKVKNDELVFSETIAVPCTKGMGDAFDAAYRLRLASGCAVGENITHFIKLLSTY